MSNTLIYHQFDDRTHGITINKNSGGLFVVTVYENGVQATHVLTGNEIADMASVVENNNIAD